MKDPNRFFVLLLSLVTLILPLASCSPASLPQDTVTAGSREDPPVSTAEEPALFAVLPMTEAPDYSLPRRAFDPVDPRKGFSVQ